MTRSLLTAALLAAVIAPAAQAQQPLPAAENPHQKMALPQGHPSIGGGSPHGALPMPATAPAEKGRLDLQINPASAGAKPIGNAPVTVNLFHDGMIVKKYNLMLDAAGRVSIPDVPLNLAVEPMVLFEHGGVKQQMIGETLDALHPNATLKMDVFETTEQAPAWTVTMQHMIIKYMPEGVQVTEMLSVNNPGDRIWLGAGNDQQNRVTLALGIPAGVANLEASGGFQEGFATVANNQIISTMPMFPGALQYQLSYVIPAPQGTATVSLVAPAAVGHLMIFTPADSSKVTATGIDGGQVMEMGTNRMRMYKAENLAAGHSITLAFSDVPVSAPAAATAASSNWARNIGAIGGVAVVLLGGGLLLLKKPNKTAKKA